MPIQIEQKMPRCRRCGKLVHERDRQRVELADHTLFCSAICRDEYGALQLNGLGASGAEAVEAGEAR